VRGTAVHLLELSEVRVSGVEPAADEAMTYLAGRHLAGCWVHLDADVLDDAAMPAVDYRQPGGLAPEELTAVLRRAMASGLPVGMSVAIYNPALDPGGAAGRALAEVVVAGLT
jgi:arginase